MHSYRLTPAANAGLTQWHDIVLSQRFEDLLPLLHADVCFRSPVAFKPY